MSLADVFNPGFDESVSIFTHLVLLSDAGRVRGHRRAPPDDRSDARHVRLGPARPRRARRHYVDVLTGLMTQSFTLGVHAAAPMFVALLLSTMVLGLVGRTLPQINIIAVGFGLNSLLTLAMLLLSLGTVAWTFQEPTIDALRTLQDSLQHLAFRIVRHGRILRRKNV